MRNNESLGDLYSFEYKKIKKNKNLKLRRTWKFKRLDMRKSGENGWMKKWIWKDKGGAYLYILFVTIRRDVSLRH